MPWIKWLNVIAPKLNGGLGIGSLKASNLALLSHWWWRIRSDKSALWNSVIVIIHGYLGGTNPHDYESNNNGYWKSIIKAGMEIHNMGFHFFKTFSRRVGRGSLIYFWTKPWLVNHIVSKNFQGCLHLKRHRNVVIVIDVEVAMITFNGYGIDVDPSEVEGRWQNSTSLWNYFVTFIMVQGKEVGISC
ncbi:hypothetical protein Tco_1168080 [Tanacetum coccineum]